MRFLNIIFPCALLLATACMPAKKGPSGPEAAQTSNQFDASYKCVAFYDAYAAYLQPSYPTQAQQYGQYAAQNRVSTFIWLYSTYTVEAPQASEAQRAAASQKAYQTRIGLWTQFLQTSSQQDIQNQVQACNAFSPQIDSFNKKLQQSPKYPELYNLYQSSMAGAR